MRKKNSKLEFSSERSELLLKNFRESLARQSRISTMKAFQDAADAPAPRFWVSEARAMRIIAPMMNGDFSLLEGMQAEKRKMYEEIFRRVKARKELHPEEPLGDIVFEVVNSPAPCSYMTADRTKRLVNALRHRRS